MPIDGATITVSNLGGLVGQYLKAIDITDNEVVLRLLHLDLLSQTTGHWQRRGFILAVSGDASQVTFTVGRRLGRSVMPRKVFTSDVFKGLTAEISKDIWMIDEETKTRIMALCNKPVALGGWLGMSGEGDEWCIKFAAKVYKEMGIDADTDALKQARNFTKVTDPQFGDIAVFRGPPLVNEKGEEEFHLAVMLDSSRSHSVDGAKQRCGQDPY